MKSTKLNNSRWGVRQLIQKVPILNPYLVTMQMQQAQMEAQRESILEQILEPEAKNR